MTTPTRDPLYTVGELLVRFAGTNRGYYVVRVVEPGCVSVVSGPWTTREQAQADADSKAAS